MSTLRVDNVTDLGDDPVVTAGVVAGGALPAGSILQVVSVAKTDTFSASVAGGGNVAVTGLTASITPISTSSKILALVSVSGSSNRGAGLAGIILTRGGTPIGVGDTAGSRSSLSAQTVGLNDNNAIANATTVFSDSPSTVSSVTYAVNVHNDSSVSRTIYVNRSNSDTDASYVARTASYITLMEVAG